MGTAASIATGASASALTEALSEEALRLLDGASSLASTGRADGKGAPSVVLAIPRNNLIRLVTSLQNLHSRVQALEAEVALRADSRQESPPSDQSRPARSIRGAFLKSASVTTAKPLTPESNTDSDDDFSEQLSWPPPTTVNRHASSNSRLLHAHLPPSHETRQRQLPEELEAFEPLSKISEIEELLEGGGGMLCLGFGGNDASCQSLEELQQRVLDDPTNATSKSQLEYRIQELSGVYMDAIKQQLSMSRGRVEMLGSSSDGGSARIGRSRSTSFDLHPSVSDDGSAWRKRLGQVIAASSDYLERVYKSSFEQVVNEEGQAFSDFERNRPVIAPDIASYQTGARTVLELFLHASSVRPRFSSFMDQLEAKLGGGLHLAMSPRSATTRFQIGPMKHLDRVLEKILLHPVCGGNNKAMDVSIIRDMVRGRAIFPTMAALTDLRNKLCSHAKAFGITIVRHKDRFLHPTIGGWRDCILNFYFNDDPNRHVCELQLMLHCMCTATTAATVPGIQVYQQVRNAYELLECAGLDMKLWWQAALGVKFRFQFDGFCNCDAATGVISTTTYITGGLATELPQHFDVGAHVPPVTHLLLRDMSLSGRLHSHLMLDLPLLRQLDLRSNALTGCVPTEVFECTKLEKLNLSRNQLTGSIPSGLEMLKNLKTLDLGNNSLSGDIPTEICQLTKLTRVALNDNKLSGPIPSLIGKLTALERLDLARNAMNTTKSPSILRHGLSGSIPSSLARLSNLKYLDLQSNLLTGPLPTDLFDLQSSLTEAESILLNGNLLTGPVPQSLVAMRQLQVLCLDDNLLTGSIPVNLPLSLTNISCARNNLEGTVPSAILAGLPSLQIARFDGNPRLNLESVHPSSIACR